MDLRPEAQSQLVAAGGSVSLPEEHTGAPPRLESGAAAPVAHMSARSIIVARPNGFSMLEVAASSFAALLQRA